MNGMPYYAVGMPPYAVEKGSEPCGKRVGTLWKRGQNPVETGSAPCGNGSEPCGNGVSTLWKEGHGPVGVGQRPVGKVNSKLDCPLYFIKYREFL
jgi:hypothetical protein